MGSLTDQKKPSRMTLLCFFVVAFSVVGIGSRAIDPGEQAAPFNRKLKASLEKQKPQLVLIGDSMLLTRVAAGTLTRLTGRSVRVIAPQGSASARWYLLLKNFVAPLATPPATVVIFFRDRSLTDPHFRTTGHYWRELQTEMTGVEPEIARLLHTPRSLLEWMHHGIEYALPLVSRTQQVQREAREFLLREINGGRNYEQFERHFSLRFAVDRLRPDVPSDRGEEVERPFADVVNDSFLPAMLKIAQEHQLRLIVHRVRRRSRAAGIPDSETLTEYLQALCSYVAAAGARCTDESDDDRLTLDFYADGDHVRRDRRKRYTELFAERIRDHLAP